MLFRRLCRVNSRMANKELKAEADHLMQKCRLGELLAAYPRWFVGGSSSTSTGKVTIVYEIGIESGPANLPEI